MKTQSKRYWVILLIWVVSFYAGWAIGYGDRRQGEVFAQGAQVTPASWTSIAGPFRFLYRSPEMLGWVPAEDKRDDRFVRGYKVDVLPGTCLKWEDVGGTPGAQLTRDKQCQGLLLTGGVYWFDTSPLSIPPTSAVETTTATLTKTPSPPTATATQSPGPTSPVQTATRTPTAAPIGTPNIIPITPITDFRSITLYPYLQSGMPYIYCYNGCLDIVMGVGPDRFNQIVNLSQDVMWEVLQTVTPVR